jgi:hypothetical protein
VQPTGIDLEMHELTLGGGTTRARHPDGEGPADRFARDQSLVAKGLDKGDPTGHCIGASADQAHVLGTHADDHAHRGSGREARRQRGVGFDYGSPYADDAFTGQELSGECAHGRAADEAGHEEVGRPIVDRLGCTHLLEASVAHHRDATGHRHRFDLIVRDVHERGADPLVQLDELGPGAGPHRGVEVGQGLVHQEDLRLAHDGASQRHPLPLPTRELCRLALEQRRDAHDLVPPCRPTNPSRHERKLDIPAHRHVGIQRVALEDHRHISILRIHVVHDAIADRDRARGGRVEAGDQAQCSRLAAARRTEEHQELAILDGEVERIDRDDLTESFGDLREADSRHRFAGTQADVGTRGASNPMRSAVS